MHTHFGHITINIIKDKKYCNLTQLQGAHCVSCMYLSYKYSLHCSCTWIFRYFWFCDWIKVSIDIDVISVSLKYKRCTLSKREYWILHATFLL